MLKEQMVNTGRIAEKGVGPERSHVCSTREEHIPDVHESTSRDKGKKPMGLSKFDAADRQEYEPQRPLARPTVFDRLGGRVTQASRVTPTEARPTNWAEQDLRKMIYSAFEDKKADGKSTVELAKKSLGEDNGSRFIQRI